MGHGLERYGLFFSLLRKSLGFGEEGRMDTEGADWGLIYSTACAHSVQALLYDAVKDLPAGSGMSPVVAAGWLVAVKNAEEGYRRVSAVVERQRALWAANGIEAVLLKGLESARFYPVPEHRVNGDVDWWMKSGEDWVKALELLRREGVRWRTDSDGDIAYECSGVVVEHHREGLAGEGPEAELLFLAEHVFHHVAVSGVGLRHLCDYAMALKYFEGKYDRGRYEALAVSGGFAGWVRLLDAAVALVVDPGRPVSAGLERRAERLLALVLEDGNFGMTRKRRFAHFFRRARVVGTSAPGRFLSRWSGLIFGRVKRFL